MKNENLHWVFCCREGNISHFLADKNNKPLAYPILKDLSEQEIHILANFDVRCIPDSSESGCIRAIPVTDRQKDTISAPLYVEVQSENAREYSMIGEYTGKWTSPEVIQHVNEMVRKIVPINKIHIHGCYVKV